MLGLSVSFSSVKAIEQLLMYSLDFRKVPLEINCELNPRIGKSQLLWFFVLYQSTWNQKQKENGWEKFYLQDLYYKRYNESPINYKSPIGV